MKHILSGTLYLASATLLFTQCKKENSNARFDVHFYTPEANTKLFLYLDADSLGPLPHLVETPECGRTATDGIAPLYRQLQAGSYRLVGKDGRGNIVSSGTLHISPERLSTSGNLGGMSVARKETCVSVRLFF